MTTTNTNTSPVVAEAIDAISHIATLPEVTIKIIELVEDPSSTAQDLQQIIQNDAALCSRILKVVNSSFYGLPGQVSTVERAIVLLGLNAVKNIAVSASMSTLFRGGRICPVLDARDLWLHAVCTATISKLLADELRLAVADEAFLAGLVHDIGLLVELQYDRARFVKVVNAAAPGTDGFSTESFRDIEREIFNADHQEFGRGLCNKWRFPDIFIQAAGYHHEPLELPAGQRSMACLIHVADRIAGSLDDLYGFRMDIESTDIDSSVLDDIGLTQTQVERVREIAPQHVDDVAALLGG